MSEGEQKVVCVTGASGYIASWVVKLLLERGYTVKASVRDPNDPTKTEHLLSLDGAKERLHLFKADLLVEGAFDAFQTLYIVSSRRIEDKSCIIFSYMFTVLNIPFLFQLWYMVSKTLAEEAAWKFAKENRIDLVTLHPGPVIGPLLQPTINFSVEALLKDITGTGAQTFPNAVYGFVDVRDVAYSHVQAFEVPSASGRYCLVERVAHLIEAFKILKELYPSLNVPEKCEDDNPLLPIYQVSKEKAKSLGVNFIPFEVSLKDTVESLKEKGFFLMCLD
ncbi:phenylacetaldehyde reductase-like [Ziziphus jujuba]|uniref:Phenylacetaldehyde reductase-like n=1 Tax=Ziziphus jujuba TaxID=326968 RepID=A0ABM4A2C8_ZIZJJ|nr:phenylacetaldehyde reductase-like [Ziziphus jujuba]